MKRVVVLLSILASKASLGVGFDDHYSAHTGDLNNDSETDIYLRHAPPLVFVDVAGIATPIATAPLWVSHFLLENRGDGTFAIEPLSAQQLSEVRQWPQAEITIDATDRNFDGATDLQLNYLSEDLAGADPPLFDHIIFASTTQRELPVQITALTPSVQQFLFETFAWSHDPDYFDERAPLRVVGTEPTGPTDKTWFAYSADPNNAYLIDRHIDDCIYQTARPCAVSASDPTICTRLIDVTDEVGNVVQNNVLVNVCAYSAHIYSYNVSVMVEPDYDYFHDDAIAFRDEVEAVLPAGVAAIDNLEPYELEALSDILRVILDRVLGDNATGDEPEEESSNFFANICRDAIEGNSFDHAAFERDHLADPESSTFHHYDVLTGVCSTATDNNCTDAILRDDVLKYFSYPSFGLARHDTPLDGTTPIMVYVAPPILAARPSAYVLPFGYVYQEVLASGNWPDAIQNITTTAHLVYPGTISRTITSGGYGGYGRRIFTHGIGENQFGTLWAPEIASQPLNMILGCANDVWGPKAFRTLDRQAIKYWRDNIN